MTIRNQVYKCAVCGNIVQVLHEGAGTLVCCGQDMELLEENSTDAAQEKHVPVIEKTATGFKIKVGEVPHPMTAEHHIEWIQIIAGDIALRKYLEVDGPAEAEFCIDADKIVARAYCNLHGLWKSEN